MNFAQGTRTIRTKEMKKLVTALEASGLKVSTTGKQHIKVVNPDTKKIVFFGGQSLGDPRVGRNILRELKMVGFNEKIRL